MKTFPDHRLSVLLFSCLPLGLIVAGTAFCDPAVDRVIQDATKQYPPGDYPGLKAAKSADSSAQAEPDQKTEMFDGLMRSVIANDYDGFVAHCDAAMKAAMTKQILDNVNKQIAPHANKGYDAQYLGGLFQRGYKVYLWRLRFKDGSDDILATMSVKNGEIGGFFLH